MKFVPHPHQEEVIEHIVERRRGAAFAPMGSGKTSATMTALRNHLDLLDGPTLVLGPLRVARDVWPAESHKWDHLRDFPVVPIIGPPDVRKAALKRDAPVYSVNYENLPWLVEHLGKRWPFRTVVADESTKLKGFRLRNGGVRAQALGSVAHVRVNRWINLTGTPAPNGLIDLWGQTWFLDGGKRLGRTFGAFKDRWFKQIPLGLSGGFKIEPWPFAQAQIEDAIRDICLTPTVKFDLDAPIVREVRVPLPAKARKLYADMEADYFAVLDDVGVEAPNAAAATSKLLQLCAGAMITDTNTGAWSEVHDAKLLALESIVEEAGGMPVLVAYQWKADRARLLRAFPKGRVLDRAEDLAAWNAGKVPVGFIHPQSAGHGLNLQDGGNILVRFSPWWNLEEFDQVLERIGPMRQKQSGHNRPVYEYRIVADDTFDEDVYDRVDNKRSVQDALAHAMKRRGRG